MSQQCIFCNISTGKIPSNILYCNDSCFVIKDIAPRAPTHLLVIPIEHITGFVETTSSQHLVVEGMFKVAQEMAQRNGLVKTGYRMVVNQGHDAGQQVDHIHMHLLGGRSLGEMG